MDYFNKVLEKKERILIFFRYGQLASTFHKYILQNPNVLPLSSRDVNFLFPEKFLKQSLISSTNLLLTLRRILT